MTTVVISQPMLFPWVGMLEQLRAADVFVHYDDVQFSKGSFTNRVQLKTAGGSRWLTLPTRNLHLGQTIASVQLDNAQRWPLKHLAQFEEAYRGAPFLKDALDLLGAVYAETSDDLCSLVVRSFETLADYFGLLQGRKFLTSSKMGIPGSSWERVLEVVRSVGGTCYVTGQGALNYLDHAAFEAAGVQVKYLDYQKTPYPQLHGDFTPFVSGLDLVANCGRGGVKYIHSPAVDWKEYVNRGRDR